LVVRPALRRARRRRWPLPRRACRAGGELAGVRARLGGTDRAV